MINKVTIKVITGAKEEKILQINETSYKIWLCKRPIEGEANKALIKLLSKFWNLPKNSIRISSGLKSKDKVIEIIQG